MRNDCKHLEVHSVQSEMPSQLTAVRKLRFFSVSSLVSRLRLLLVLTIGVSFLYMPFSHAQEPLIDLAAELAAIKQKERDENGNPIEKLENQASQNTAEEKASSSSSEQAPQHGTHWSYDGETGPRHWGKLSDEFRQCAEGLNQSPINIKEVEGVGAQGLPELDIRYRDVPLKVVNSGHGLQVNYPLGSYIIIGGKRYELLQYHFHTPSEHQKEGFNYPMEVHLVHKNGDGHYAVIGILFQEGQENPFLKPLLERLPQEVGKVELHEEVSINPVNFLPVNTEFFKYNGSLTTPPCSEGVYWMVFKQPTEASARQLMTLNEYMGDNARPPQALNARALLKSWLELAPDTQVFEFY